MFIFNDSGSRTNSEFDRSSINVTAHIGVEIQHKGELGFLVDPERPRERMVPPMQATVFKAASKKRLKTAFSRQLPAMVSRPFQCRMASSKTLVF